MRNKLTLLTAFCLLALGARAQLTDVATGLAFPYSVALHGNELYISENGGDRISKIDITQPLPTTATTVLSAGFSGGLLIDGDTLYYSGLVSGKIFKVDLTQSPLSPQLLVDLPTNAAALHIINNQLYVATEINGTIVKLDLGQPNPTPVTVVAGMSTPFGLAGAGDVLYVSEFGGGKIYKIDLSQTNPVPTTVATGLNQAGGLYLDGNFLYVAYGGTNAGALGRLDITQPNPTVEAVVSGLNNPRLCVFSGLDLYIAEAGSGSGSNGKISKIAIAQPVFSALSACDNTTATLGGASPGGGTYSGPGVTDDDNGQTFTFDPVAAGGPGAYTVTYTAINGQQATATLTVNAAPVVTISNNNVELPLSTPPIPINDGTPAGGIYSGPGVLPGNIFDASVAGIGVHILTYTVTDANGCTGTATGTVTVLAPGDACAGANDLNDLLGGPQNEPQTSSLYNNSGYDTANDPAVNAGCFYSNDALQHTIWYSFTGDGNTYRIRSVQCSATNYIPDGDTQVAIFTGDCNSPTQVTCNEDENGSANILNFSVEIATQAGETYWMLVDGYDGAQGEFCLEVTNLSASATTEIGRTGIRIAPNPTTGLVHLTGVEADLAQAFDVAGRLVFAQLHPGATLDLSGIPAGTYFLRITEKEAVYSARLIKE